jgi:UDP-GlcNAc:undecaprenyl-phosphate GlcNAc-1-phosphate transferase
LHPETPTTTGIIEAYGLLFFTALFLSLLVTPLTIQLARKLGVVDTPNERSMHTQSKTRLGGLGIAVGLCISVLVFLPFNAIISGFLAGLVVIVLVGLIDDIYQVRALYKLLGQILAAGVFILVSGKTLVTMGDLFGTGDLRLGWLQIPVTIFCIAGFINALNLSDGLDGLAGGITAIAALFLMGLAIQGQQWESFAILLALLGAIIGFLRYNTFPARLFMGDTGSLLLGYTLAACSVIMLSGTADSDPLLIKPVSMLVILIIPLMDTTYVMTRRAILGINPFHPDKTHLHHKLITLGVPHGAVVSLLYLGMFFFGALSILILDYPDWLQALITILIAIATYTTIAQLQKTSHKNRTILFTRIGEFDHRLLEKARSFLRVTTKPVAIFSLIALLWPAFFLDIPSTKIGWVVFAFIGLMLASYSWLHQESHIGLLRGTLYLAIFLLLFLYNFLLAKTNPWLGSYLYILSGAILAWVILKFLVKSEKEVLLTTGYEAFALIFTWILPVAILPAIVSEQNRYVIDIFWDVCLQSIPYLLAVRLFIRRHSKTAKTVLLLFALAFTALGINLALGT